MGLRRRRHGSPLQQLLAHPQPLRAFVLPMVYVLLQLLLRKVVLPAVRNPEAPVSAVLGHGVCSSDRFAAHSGNSSSGTAAAHTGPGGVSGGILWRMISGVVSSLLSLFMWLFSRAKSRLMRDLCQALAELCDSPRALHAADCAALFDAD